MTNEAAALSTTTISLKDKTTALKKRGRMLRASYEAIKFQRLDLFTLALRRIGAEIARCQMKDAVDVLVNGDGSTGSAPAKLTTAATTLAYSDLLTLWSKFTAYQMNTLLVNAKTAAAILELSAFSDPTTGLHFQNTGKLGTPLGAEIDPLRRGGRWDHHRAGPPLRPGDGGGRRRDSGRRPSDRLPAGVCRCFLHRGLLDDLP